MIFIILAIILGPGGKGVSVSLLYNSRRLVPLTSTQGLTYCYYENTIKLGTMSLILQFLKASLKFLKLLAPSV